MVDPRDFVILPWSHWAPSGREQLEGIRDCGFNLAGFVRPEHLDLCADVGLKAIVMGDNTHVGDAEADLPDDEIERRVNALVQRVGEHPGCFGY